ncbi:N-acetyltransferase [Pseudooceanicola sp. CBS1P-1]|uniref:GNAT family N-acetyltransferase n=1 Tax=Pseudooceanicola albus TaxID=2692189 RepID=A0A6L7G889_9RHOB|nr:MULTISPECIES: N-acetyltransferase [Pseudooceanicola]MBT9382927.1 N-acetyltransferase [Pseudooceanicola endophyticus]MXN20149.1 GNAT family N-acetyltransferase [Pseudooceanicola albus]
MAKNVKITMRLFEPGDEVRVGNVLTQGYETPAEARLVSTLRDNGDMAVELLAFDARDEAVGYIGFSRHVSPEDWFALSSLSVIPSYHGSGIGADLIRYGLDYARRARAAAVTVLGDGRYYQRFGFTYKAAQNLSTPYDAQQTLMYPIKPGTAFAHERLVYAEAFDALDMAPTR